MDHQDSFKMHYLKKEVNDEVYLWYADKHRGFYKYYHFECAYSDMPKVPKISLYIFAISPKNRER